MSIWKCAVRHLQLDREGSSGDFEEEAYQPKALLPFMKRVPAKRVVHLPDQAKDPLSFNLAYNASWPLPSGINNPVLAAFDVTGVSRRVTPLPYSPIVCTQCITLQTLIHNRLA